VESQAHAGEMHPRIGMPAVTKAIAGH
jgi:hypothetical protein